MKRLVVIGGGISGLAAARAAVDAARVRSLALEVVVLEKERHVGGKAVTAREGDWLVEGGPTGYLAPDPAIDRLVSAVGLDRERLPADEAAAKRFVVRGGTMRQVETHPLRFVRAGILGPSGLLRAAAEPFLPGRRDGGEESVWDFARRRLGRQVADRLVSPMVLGVFAGDARKLSLEAAFPRLHALEAEHGSLVRGMLARRRAAKAARASAQSDASVAAGARPDGGAAARGSGAAAAGSTAGGPTGPAGHLTSFRAGIATLPEALARGGSFDVRCSVAVEAVERQPDGGFRIRAAGDALHADAVVLAAEAFIGASLLERVAPEVASLLAEIVYPPVAVVALGFAAAAVAAVPHGFGVLIPRGEGYRALGVLWDSYIFPGRSPEGTLLLRLMFGGAVDPEAGGAGDDQLEAWARADLRRLSGVSAEPVFRHVRRWPRAIPQYELGHVERVRRIQQALSREPGLFLAGNALHGIAFGKAAAAGIEAGEAAVAQLGSARPGARR